MTTEFEYLKEWILNFLSTPQKLLNGFPPCPYAKKALIDNKVMFFKSVDYVKDIEHLFNNWDDQYDVAVCVVPDDTDTVEFVDAVNKLNERYVDKGFGCLEDHKEIAENFHDLQFNNGRYNIILCQRLDKINDAAEKLLSKGYYKNWSKEMYDEVVTWRLRRS
jgi:hypothetical protein